MRVFLLLLPIVLALTSCVDEDDLNVSGKKPVYIAVNELMQFEQLPPQPIVEAGKIMLYQNYLFLGDVNHGIHVYDMSDTLHPQKIYYLKIPGNKDMTSQNDRMYVDNGPHLLILDISNIHNIVLVDRQMNVFHPSETYPKEYSGYFECFDENLGWLIGWEDAQLTNPECKR